MEWWFEEDRIVDRLGGSLYPTVDASGWANKWDMESVKKGETFISTL